MTTETAITIITPRSFDDARSMSTTLAKATLLPPALRGKEADVLLTIMAGAELGLGPIQSIRAINVIDGKPTLSADLIAALCLRSRDVCEYLQPVETTAQKATYTAKRKGAPNVVTMTFTIEDAQRAGLTGKANWTKYPAAMLRARCISAICRAVFPDLVGGLYDSDSGELETVAITPPKASPPGGVIDVVATPVPAGVPDYDAAGAPVSERAKLEVAVTEAQDEATLSALVERITKLPPDDKARVRQQWGVRRNELRAAVGAEVLP